jgi:NhaA family Na+:H+ antiporter
MSGTEHEHHIRAPWSGSDRAVPRLVVRPLQEFLRTSTASAALLFGAVLGALLWANLAPASYASFWHTEAGIGFGGWSLELDLRHWVNDGLMTIFFLVVGLEIKREVTTGELRRWRAAALPVLAAIGGMVVPAVIYLAVTAGGPASRGWGVPMATDIAFALGVLALAARHAPAKLKPLLLTLAIVDDIGAILVIAIFYSSGVSFANLELALLMIVLILLAQRAHIRSPLPYALLGAVLWYEVYLAGIHPTIAGVILGLLTPASAFQRPRAVSEEAIRTANQTEDDPSPPDADAAAWTRLAWLSKEAVPPLTRVEHLLLPWSSFVILPIFALANAGVQITAGAISAALGSAVALGIVLGLVIGKPMGITLAAAAGVRGRLARLPGGVGWGDLGGMGVVAGVGFTMSLFIAELAFKGTGLLDQAKIAILVASLVAGIAGYLVLWAAPNAPEAPEDDAEDRALTEPGTAPS